jgi:hypothetical protein
MPQAEEVLLMLHDLTDWPKATPSQPSPYQGEGAKARSGGGAVDLGAVDG